MTLTKNDVAPLAESLVAEIEKAIAGKHDTVVQTVLTLLCKGHLLIEDIPGVGKTTLAKAVAAAIGGEFRRIQFTPDLLPADVTGSSIYNQRDHTFEFRPGPIFANVVLVDEINRATPKTQSALLEAMEERQVTSDGVTRALPKSLFVLATQNNIEMTGTFPLPEAQMDRFFARVRLGYPDRETEFQILKDQQVTHPLATVRQVRDLAEIEEAQRLIRDTFVHDTVRQYVVDLVRATRESSLLALGSSPRGSLYLMQAAQGLAAMRGGEYVRPDDVKEAAPLVLGHRVIVRSEVRAGGRTPEQIIAEIVERVPAPVPVA